MKPVFASHLKGCAQAADWLRQEERLGLLYPSALSLCQLERSLRSLRLSPLLSTCHVSGLSNGDLKLLVPTSAHAAKLNQLAPALVSELNRLGFEVSHVRIRVQGGSSGGASSAKTYPQGKHAVLSQQGVAALTECADALAPSPLKDALERFAQRHRRR